MKEDEEDADDAVARHGDDQAGEVDPHDARLQFEPHDGKVADVIGTKGKYEDKESVEGDNPEDVLQEDQGPVQTQQSLPSQFLRRSVPFYRVPLICLGSSSSHSSINLIQNLWRRRLTWSQC